MLCKEFCKFLEGRAEEDHRRHLALLLCLILDSGHYLSLPREMTQRRGPQFEEA